MSDYITLLGAEDVRSAAHSMQNAAYTIQRAVNQMEEIFQRHQQFLLEQEERRHSETETKS